MTTLLDVVFVIHTVFAALWTGGTILVTWTVLPAARNGMIGKEGVALIKRRFSYLAIVSVIVMLFTGGHLAGNLYEFDALMSTQRGNLVMTMATLWLILSIVLLGGFWKLSEDSLEQSVQDAATAARPWFIAGSVVSLVLLIVAGLL